MTQEWKDIASYVVDLEQQVLRLKGQRDELAAALRACVDNYYNSEGDEQSCARAGREALAKTEAA